MKTVLWREVKGELTAPITAIGHFIVPIFYVVFFAAAFGSNISHIAYRNLPFRYTEFFIPGVIAFQTFSLFSWTFSMVRIDRASNIVAIFLTSGVHPTIYFAGKLIASILITTVRCLIVLGISLSLAYVTLPSLANLGIAFTGLLLGSVVWLCLGFICGVFITREDLRDIVFSILTLPITFTSSMYYNIELAPQWVRAIGKFNPLTYTADTIRCGMLGLKVSSSNLLILALSCAVSLSLALRACRRMS